MFYAPPYKPAMVKKYLARGADPNGYVSAEELGLRGSGFSIDPLRYVLMKRDYKTADLLIAHGCCIHNGKKSLFYRAFGDLQDSLDGKSKGTDKTLKYLISRGADFGTWSDWGSTCIMECAIFDNDRGIKFLVDRGFDVNLQINPRYHVLTGKSQANGWSALFFAAGNRRVNATDALIAAGADVNLLSDGKTVLDWILKNGQKDDSRSTSYAQELSRLRAIAYDKLPDSRQINLPRLLRLAGAKLAGELAESPSREPAAK